MGDDETYVLYEIERKGERRRSKFKTKEQAVANFDANRDVCIYEVTYGLGNYGSLSRFSKSLAKVKGKRRIYG